MKYYSTREMADIWDVSIQLVRKYLKDGRIPTAVLENGVWMIPEGTEKPGLPPKEQPDISAFVKRLLYQKERNNHFCIYEYLQVNLAYSSNRMASNRLTRVQVQEIYRTNRIGSSFESTKVDDILEIVNHFSAMSVMLDTVMEPLSHSYIKEMHHLLTYGTFSDRKRKVDSGSYRRDPARIGSKTATDPNDITKALSAVIREYEKKTASLESIVDFHVRFERIRPFSDYNGRVGRLLMVKECLRYNVDPFIIDDKRRSEYTRGIAAWDTNPEILMTAVRESQQRFQAKMEVCKLMQYERDRKF